MFGLFDEFHIGNVITEIANLVVTVVKAIAMVVKEVGQALGIIEENMTPEDLGDRALQAEEAGIVPENFDTYEEYVAELNNFELDPEKSAEIDEKEKLLKGIEVTTQCICEKNPDSGIVDFMEFVCDNKEYFSSEKIAALYDIIKDVPDIIEKLGGYLSGSDKNVDNNKEALHTLIAVEKAVDPEISTEKAVENIEKAEH